MTLHNSYSGYKDTQIKTASPVSLIILMYDGAMNHIRRGEAGLVDNEKFVDSASHLMKAVSIVTELIGIINPKIMPELAEGLAASYQHVLGLLADALKERDPAPLQQAFEVMGALRSAWQEVAQKTEKQAG